MRGLARDEPALGPPTSSSQVAAHCCVRVETSSEGGTEGLGNGAHFQENPLPAVAEAPGFAVEEADPGDIYKVAGVVQMLDVESGNHSGKGMPLGHGAHTDSAP
jgi:hypothetical protein